MPTRLTYPKWHFKIVICIFIMQLCMIMNWDDLRIFLQIARAGSISAAARRLGVNQSTVSRRLAAMEGNLGVRLCNRRFGGAPLTAAGEELLERAEEIGDGFDQIEREIAGRDTRLSGRLRITSTDNFLNRYLAPHLVRFARMHPVIDLELSTSYQHLSIARREADVAIRTTPKPSDTLVGRRLFCCALAAYATPEFVATLPPDPDPGELTWIGWSSEAYNRLMITNHFPNANIRHWCNSQHDIVTMARAGLGVAVTGCFGADPDPGLARVYPEPITDTAMDLWVLTHPDLLRVARVREFTAFIADTFLADRDLFEGQQPMATARHSIPARFGPAPLDDHP